MPIIHISTLPAAGETKLGFFLFVKKVQVIHISTLPVEGEKKIKVFFVKKVPVISYAHFWNLIFPKKRKEKKEYELVWFFFHFLQFWRRSVQNPEND